jgi:opacity protein-like surface antigen
LKRSLFAIALSGMALVSLPFAARAQVSAVAKPFQFGIAAGAALPMDQLKDATDMGFNVTGTIGFQPQLIPLGIRVDVAYNSFGIKGSFNIPGNIHFTSVTGNLVWSIPSTVVSPYFIGGAGLYNAAADIPGFFSGSDNKFGFNIGGGIKMPLSGFDTFLEARYNQVQGDGGSAKFIPITFGLMF